MPNSLFRSVLLSLAIFLCLTLAERALSEDRREVLFNFESPGRLAAEWTAAGKMDGNRVALRAAPPVNSPAKGWGVELTSGSTGDGGWFVSRPGAVTGVTDLLKVSQIEMWIYRSPAQARKRSTDRAEIQFIETDGCTRFWSKVELSHTGWRKVVLPLRYFRTSAPKVPRWDAVDRLSIALAPDITVQVDEIALQRTATPNVALLGKSELLKVAFPKLAESAVRCRETDRWQLFTDHASLDVDELAAHLARVEQVIEYELPFLPEPEQPARLLAFANDRDYRAFPPRFASLYSAHTPEPRADGLTLDVTASSCWKTDMGPVRPVLTHEFTHAVLASRAQIQNTNEWLQEGFATHLQLRFHPQDNFSHIVQEGLDKPEARGKLSEVCNGDAIPAHRYWQAATVVDMLLHAEHYAPKKEALLKAITSSDSSDLGPHLKPVYNRDWTSFTADWMKHCQEHHGRWKGQTASKGTNRG